MPLASKGVGNGRNVAKLSASASRSWPRVTRQPPAPVDTTVGAASTLVFVDVSDAATLESRRGGPGLPGNGSASGAASASIMSAMGVTPISACLLYTSRCV